jgi:4-amino-4-deoxy-L-arabinose transferase-like glycosyltransferase
MSPSAAGARRWDYLSAAVVLCLLCFAALLAVRIWFAVSYPFVLDTGEGTALSAAFRASRGGTIYGTIENPPYFFTIYNPVLPYLCGLAYRVFGPSHVGPRLLVVSFYLGTGLFVYLFLRRETRLRSAALVAALFFLVERHLYSRAGYAVTDYPAIFFSVLGLYLWRGGGRRQYFAVISFALAFFSKQTSLMAAAAAFVSLFLEGRRWRSTGLFALFLLVVGAGTAAGWIMWGRGYIVNTLYYAFTGPFAVRMSIQGVAIAVVLYGAPMLGWLYYAAMSLKDKRLLLPVAYVFFGLLLACTSGKVGASRSYFFDLTAALSIIVGLLWAGVRARLLQGGATPLILAGTGLQVTLIGVGMFFGLSVKGERTASDLAHDTAVFEAFNSVTGMILYREPGFDIDAVAENVSNDTYKLSQLIRDSAVPSDKLIAPVRDRAFSMIIMRKKEDSWTLFTSQLRGEVMSNYDVSYEKFGEAFLVAKQQSGKGN